MRHLFAAEISPRVTTSIVRDASYWTRMATTLRHPILYPGKHHSISSIKEGNYVYHLVDYRRSHCWLAHRQDHEWRRLWSPHGHRHWHRGGGGRWLHHVAPRLCRVWWSHLHRLRCGNRCRDTHPAASARYSWACSANMTTIHV